MSAIAVSRLGLRAGRRPSVLAVALIGFAGLLSVAMVALVLGQRGADWGAAVAAVTMTAPVVYARRAPTVAGFSLAVAAGANGVIFGHLVRCGAALPAAFLVSFVAGCTLRRHVVAAVTGTVISLVLQCVYDPHLGLGTIALMVPLDLVFAGAGRYVHTRATMITALRDSTAALYEQRERTVRLAVAVERQELTQRLNHTLHQRLEAIAQVARHGNGDRFATIEQLGRQTLEQMRELLGSLRDSPTEPEPGLADLAGICARTTTAEVRLTVNGTRRALPPSIELTVCRIVEQLLRILPDDPTSRIQLDVDIDPAGIDIAVAGRAAAGDVDLEQVRSLAQARAVMHGGSVAVADRSGERRARVWLPLVTRHG